MLCAHEQPFDCRMDNGIDHSIMDEVGVLALVCVAGQRGTFEDLQAWVHAANCHEPLLLALETLLQWFRPSEDTDDADDPAVAAARQAHAAVKLARGEG